jgi:hypothetical protein
MNKYIEIKLKINGTSRYHFQKITPDEYFEKLYLPIKDLGGVINEITKEDFYNHENSKYIVSMNFDGFENVETYCSEFVNEVHEKIYLSLFN